MERDEQLACAYRAVANANHYMVGIVEAVTDDERDAAEQYLITWQNAQAEGSDEWKHLDLALDVLENDRKRARA
jgi:hypothetical protein